MMRLKTFIFFLSFAVLGSGVAAAYTGSVSTGETDEFNINGEVHSVTLNFIDGGAKFSIDGHEAEYVRPLQATPSRYGLTDGDTFTVNGVTVEVREAIYDTESGQGTLRFDAYAEKDTKRIFQYQERQFFLNGETRVLALKYLDGGAAIRLDERGTETGNELQSGDTFSHNGVTVEAVETGYTTDRTKYLDFRIRTDEDEGLGRVKATCEYFESSQGPQIGYSIYVPDSSNYRDVNIFAVIEENGDERQIMEYGRNLEAGYNNNSRPVRTSVVPPGSHEITLQVVNELGPGMLETSCGTHSIVEGDLFSRVGFNVSGERLKKEFSTDAEAKNGMQEIVWDLNGDNQYEKTGRTVSETFDETGEKRIGLKVTDANGNSQRYSETVLIESNDRGGASISLDSERVRRGGSIGFQVSAPNSRAESGFQVLIESPEGEILWRENGDQTHESYSASTGTDWASGEYTVKLMPEGNILSSVLGIITGNEALAKETFAVTDARWKKYCGERGYEVVDLESRIDCISSKIVPEYFEEDVPSDAGVAVSLCQDLLGYSYDKEAKACVK